VVDEETVQEQEKDIDDEISEEEVRESIHQLAEELQDLASGRVKSSDEEEVLICGGGLKLPEPLQEVQEENTLRARHAALEFQDIPSSVSSLAGDEEMVEEDGLSGHRDGEPEPREERSEDFTEMLRCMQEVLAMSQDLLSDEDDVKYETIHPRELETIETVGSCSEELDEDSIDGNEADQKASEFASKRPGTAELVTRVLKRTSFQPSSPDQTLFGITLPGKVLSKMNVSPTEDTPANLIEAMRVYLEENIGLDKFLAAYHFLKLASKSQDYDEERFTSEVEKILAEPEMEYLQVLSQLIAAEEGLIGLES